MVRIGAASRLWLSMCEAAAAVNTLATSQGLWGQPLTSTGSTGCLSASASVRTLAGSSSNWGSIKSAASRASCRLAESFWRFFSSLLSAVRPSKHQWSNRSTSPWQSRIHLDGKGQKKKPLLSGRVGDGENPTLAAHYASIACLRIFKAAGQRVGPLCALFPKHTAGNPIVRSMFHVSIAYIHVRTVCVPQHAPEQLLTCARAPFPRKALADRAESHSTLHAGTLPAGAERLQLAESYQHSSSEVPFAVYLRMQRGQPRWRRAFQLLLEELVEEVLRNTHRADKLTSVALRKRHAHAPQDDALPQLKASDERYPKVLMTNRHEQLRRGRGRACKGAP